LLFNFAASGRPSAISKGTIMVSRSFGYQGPAETFFYRDLTDSENNATIRTSKDVKSKTRWDQ